MFVDHLRGIRRISTATAAIAESAGRIRRTADVALPDALIAATALEHGLAVLTRNVRRFARVDGLRVVDPAG